MQALRRFGTDILGVCLIVAAILFGWIPGPGGIPLFIAGLSLLAINHKWARKLLKKAKQQGVNLSGAIFREHPVWRLTLDVLSVVLFATGVWFFSIVEKNVLRGLAISMVILAIGLFLGNRRRLSRLIGSFKT